MPIIDLNQLPAPDVVEELDFETILAERQDTDFLLPGRPAGGGRPYPDAGISLSSNCWRKMLIVSIWRQRVNEAARAVMLACAAGNDPM